MNTPDSLFSEEELEQLHALEASPLWAYLKKGLEDARNASFSSGPRSTDPFDVGRLWGRIEILTDLLQRGPVIVLQYRNMPAESESGTDLPPVRDFYRGE
jgi:hypothetical protein